MWNAANKLILTAFGIAVLTACTDKEAEAAKEMLASAQEEYDAGRYEAALTILDSINSQYPSQVDIRRDGMHLRPQIIEKQSLIELQEIDSLLAELSAESTRLQEFLTKNNDGFEGYLTTKKMAGKIPADKDGLYARMSADDGIMTLIASARQGTLSTAVKLSAGGDDALSSTIEYDGERNDRSLGRETITFLPDEWKELGRFVKAHDGEEIKLTFIGEKSYTITLDPDQSEAMKELFSASDLFGRLQSAQLEKTRLEKQIEIARSQMARTYQEKTE